MDKTDKWLNCAAAFLNKFKEKRYCWSNINCYYPMIATFPYISTVLLLKLRNAKKRSCSCQLWPLPLTGCFEIAQLRTTTYYMLVTRLKRFVSALLAILSSGLWSISTVLYRPVVRSVQKNFFFWHRICGLNTVFSKTSLAIAVPGGQNIFSLSLDYGKKIKLTESLKRIWMVRAKNSRNIILPIFKSFCSYLLGLKVTLFEALL